MPDDLLSRAEVRRMLNQQRPGTLRRVRVVDRDPVAKTATVIYPNEPDPEPFEVPLTQGIVPIVDRDIWVQTPAGGSGAVPIGVLNPASIQYPYVRLQKTGVASIPSGGAPGHLVGFNEAAVDDPPGDDFEMYDEGASTTQITIPWDGPYEVGFNLSWTDGVAGQRRIAEIRVNGGPDVVCSDRFTSRVTDNAHLAAQTVWFAAGDFLELQVFQDSGAGKDLQVLGRWSPSFYAKFSP